jgi:hypothetical protein
MTPIDRRRFIQLALSSVAASGAGLAMLGFGGDRTRDFCKEDAAQWLPDLDAARALGSLYLDNQPDRKELRTLEQRIFQLEPGQSADEPNPETLRWLNEQVRSDFSTGRVVDVSGWRLAKTEAELCALAALATC